MMIALVVFAVGTLAAMDVIQRAQAAETDGEQVLIATHLSHRHLEELRNAAYAAVLSEAKAPIASPTGFTRFSREVTVTTPYAGLKQVVARVWWNSPGGETSVTLQTYRSAF